MKRRQILILTLSLLLAFSLSQVSCMGEDPEDPDLNKLLRIGKHHLEKGDGARAYNYYKDALDIDPDSPKALWRLVISDGERMISNLDGIVDILAGVYIYEPSRAECEVACERLGECDFYELVDTSEWECVADCPWGLQPDMFEGVTEKNSCSEVRDKAIDWIISVTEEDCVDICDDLDFCGLLNPPETYNLEECYDRCPTMYVEHHTKCYMRHLGECNRRDRTCFEHTIVGLQILFREMSGLIPPELFHYSDILMDRPEEQYQLKHHAWRFTQPPMELMLDGRYGVEEMHFIRSVGYLYSAFVELATSTNLDVNTTTFDVMVHNMDITFAELLQQPIDRVFYYFAVTLENILYDPVFPGAGAIMEGEENFAAIEKGGKELGKMFGEFAAFLYYMMEDDDRQIGKALGYNDANHNFMWDPEEILEFRGLGITINRYQADALAAMTVGMERNFLYREPFQVELLEVVLDTYGMTPFNAIIDLLLGASGTTEIDISELFYNTNPEGARPLIKKLVEILYQLEEAFKEE